MTVNFKSKMNHFEKEEEKQYDTFMFARVNAARFTKKTCLCKKNECLSGMVRVVQGAIEPIVFETIGAYLFNYVFYVLVKETIRNGEKKKRWCDTSCSSEDEQMERIKTTTMAIVRHKASS